MFKSMDATTEEAAEIERFNGKYFEALQEAKNNGLLKTEKTTEQFFQEAVQANPVMQRVQARQSEFAKALSLGYMSMTASAGIYGEALDGGYNRRTAGVAALLAAGTNYGIMAGNSMGDWFLDKTTGYSTNMNTKVIKDAISPYLKDVEASLKLMDITPELGKASLKTTLLNAKASIASAFDSLSYGSEDYWKTSLVQGTEMAAIKGTEDATKGMIDAAASLGITKRKDNTEGFGGWNNVFSESGVERYVSTIVGGFIGGPLFKLNEKIIEPFLAKDSMPKPETASVIHEIANGNLEGLLKETEKYRKRFNNKLSPVSTEIGDKELFLPANGSTTQGDVVADTLTQVFKTLDGILNQENLKQTDDDLFKKALLNNISIPLLKDAGLDKIILKDFNSHIIDIVKLNSQLKDLDTKVDSSGIRKSELNSDLNQKRKEVQEILNGEKAGDYVEKSLFYLIKPINEAYSELDIDTFTKGKYKQDYNSLPETGAGLSKERVNTEYNDFVAKKNTTDYLDIKVAAYKGLQEVFSPILKEYSDSTYLDVRKRVLMKIVNSAGFLKLGETVKTQEGKNFLKEITDVAKQSGLNNITLENMFNTKLSDYLVRNKLLDFSEYDNIANEEDRTTGIAKTKEIIDRLGSNLPLQELNTETISKIMEKVNTQMDSIVKGENPDSEVEVVAPHVKLKPSEYQQKVNDIENNRVKEKNDVPYITNTGDELLDRQLKSQEVQHKLTDINKMNIDKPINIQTKITRDNKITKDHDAEFANLTATKEDKLKSSLTKQGTVNKIKEKGINTRYEERFKALEEKTANARKELSDTYIENNKKYSILEKYEQEFKGIDLKHDTLLEALTKKDSVVDLGKIFLFESLEKEPIIDNELLIDLKKRLTPQVENTITDFTDALSVTNAMTGVSLFGGTESVLGDTLSSERIKERILANINDGLSYTDAFAKEKEFIIKSINDNSQEINNIYQDDVIPELTQLVNTTVEFPEDLTKFDGLLSKPRTTNSLYDFLRKFEVSLGGGVQKSIFHLLEEESNSLKMFPSIDEYLREGYKADQITNAVNLLKMAKGLVHGMTETVISTATPFGFNQSIRHFLEKNDMAVDAEKFASINTNQSVMLNIELDMLQTKLQFLKNLSDSNSESKAAEQTKSRESFNTTLLDKYNTLKLSYKGQNLLDGLSSAFLPDDQNEDKLQKVEMLLYTNFKKLSLTKEEYPAFIKDTFSKFN